MKAESNSQNEGVENSVNYNKELSKLLVATREMADKMELHGHIDPEKVRYHLLPPEARKQAAIQMSSEGMSNRKIAKELGVTPQTISNDLNELKDTDKNLSKSDKNLTPSNADGSPPESESAEENGQPQENKPEIPPQTPQPEPKPKRGRLGRKVGEVIVLEEWKKLSKEEKDVALGTKGDSKFTSQDTDSIEWALWSWNPVTGCLHDCPYCYARDIANRLYQSKFQPAIWPGRLIAPTNTKFPDKKAAEWMGHKNVFVCSMADLFGRWVPKEWIDKVLESCAGSPQWNFLFLTKFPNRMSEFEFPDNCWVGTTVDQQARVANAERSMARVKAKVRWLSCEPLIEPLKFKSLDIFQWIVIGGASSSTKTPAWIPPFDWIVDLRRQAKETECKVYFKTNLGIENRIREYPGVDAPEQAKCPLVYLPQEIG